MPHIGGRYQLLYCIVLYFTDLFGINKNVQILGKQGTKVIMMFAAGVDCALTGCCLSPTPRVSCLILAQDECVPCQ